MSWQQYCKCHLFSASQCMLRLVVCVLVHVSVCHHPYCQSVLTSLVDVSKCPRHWESKVTHRYYDVGWHAGVLVKAMQNGHWIILDELNLAPSDVLEALNRVSAVLLCCSLTAACKSLYSALFISFCTVVFSALTMLVEVHPAYEIFSLVVEIYKWLSLTYGEHWEQMGVSTQAYELFSVLQSDWTVIYLFCFLCEVTL